MAPAQSRFNQLLDFFEANTPLAAQPIPHPDAEINRMLQQPDQNLRSAAVLIPVTRHCEHADSEVVLTVRSANLKSHAGQISLPGGSREEQDTDLVATALRESEEEIGLSPQRVQVLGCLGEMALPSGYRITPVVGVIDPGIDFVPCPIEVADIFSAPLDLILDPEAYGHSTMRYGDQRRKVLEVHYEDYRIWGATAAILFHLAREVQEWSMAVVSGVE